MKNIEVLSQLYQSSEYEVLRRECENLLVSEPGNVEYINYYGAALFRLGESYQGIKQFKKILAINPQNADAHNNLGTIHQTLFEYDRAKQYFKKAIAIDPSIEQPYINHALISYEDGDIEEAIKFVNLGLEKKNDAYAGLELVAKIIAQMDPINNWIERKIQTLSSNGSKQYDDILSKLFVYSAIANFINGKLLGSEQNLISATKYFKDKTKRNSSNFTYIYYDYLIRLVKQLPRRDISYQRKVYHLGESHSLAFANRILRFCGDDYYISARICFGAKAFHFSGTNKSKYKTIISQHFKSLPQASAVFLSFGEIDCRADEGIIIAAKKLEQSVEEVISATVSNYVSWFHTLNLTKRHELYFYEIHAPVYSDVFSQEVNEQRLYIVRTFNNFLQKSVTKHGYSVIPTYDATKNASGYSNKAYNLDDYHLNEHMFGLIQQFFEQKFHN